eukprot:scaffold684_cov95-Isochrysis_galbana.AAC.1
MGEGRGSVRTAGGQRSPAMSPLVNIFTILIKKSTASEREPPRPPRNVGQPNSKFAPHSKSNIVRSKGSRAPECCSARSHVCPSPRVNGLNKETGCGQREKGKGSERDVLRGCRVPVGCR